jgi:putative hydrolase of the HAD superfamily
MNGIRAILFDLGGVLLNLDFNKTTTAFSQLLGAEFTTAFYSKRKQNELFDHLEKGMITAEEFRDNIREKSGRSLTDAEIDECWSAMLLDFPKKRILFIQQLSKKIPVYLFSNTNEIHKRAFDRIFAESFKGLDFDKLFTKAFYSHEIGLRKPDVEAYERVLKEVEAKPSEVLFIDDHPDNIIGANQAGLQTILFTQNAEIEDLDIWDKMSL